MERVSRSAWLTLGVVSAAVFMVSIELTIIALALPEIRASLPGSSTAAVSWVVNVYSIVVAALLLLSGWLADRYGRRRIFPRRPADLRGWLSGSGSRRLHRSAHCGPGPAGCGRVDAVPGRMALLLTAFPQHRRQLAIGMWSAMAGLAAAIGPTVGGFLIGAAGWRAVFYVNVPIALVSLIVGARVLTESKAGSAEGKVDLIGVPLASLGVGAIILGFVQGDAWGWTTGPTLGAFVAGVAMIATFVARSLHHPAPLFDLGLLRIRSFALGNLGTLFFCMGFFSLLVPLPSFIQEVWGWSVTETGLAVAAGPVVSFLTSPQAGRLADRIGNAPILVVGSACGMIGLLWLLASTSTTPSLAKLLGATLLIGVSAGTGFSQLVGPRCATCPRIATPWPPPAARPSSSCRWPSPLPWPSRSSDSQPVPTPSWPPTRRCGRSAPAATSATSCSSASSIPAVGSYGSATEQASLPEFRRR